MKPKVGQQVCTGLVVWTVKAMTSDRVALSTPSAPGEPVIVRVITLKQFNEQFDEEVST